MRGANVIVTATSATEPVLRGEWLAPGAHVNAIGACVAGWRELDDDVMRHVVYVDSRAAAAVESGDVILSKCPVHAELGELFAGTVPSRAEETTVFKSLGLAVEDVAAASLVWNAYRGSERPRLCVCCFCAPTTAPGRRWPRPSCDRWVARASRSRARERSPVACTRWRQGSWPSADSTLLDTDRSRSTNSPAELRLRDHRLRRGQRKLSIFPGAVQRIHWSIADPSAAQGTEAHRLAAFERAATELRSRIELLVNEAAAKRL